MAKKKTDTGQLDLFGESNTIQLLNGQIAMIEKKILALFGSTYKYAAQLAQVRDSVNSGNASFTFQNNPAAAKEIENRLTAVAQTLDQQLAKSTEQSYALGQASTNNALVQAFGKDKQTKKELKEISDDAVAAMRKRGADGHTFYTQPQGGVTISDRVWKLTESTKLELEIAIQNAVLEGQSADELARTIQQYLVHPDRLFRSIRVIDKETGQWTGEYKMSEAAKKCHPGQGVYRSSYKNALRLARTELTQAYRRAEWETYQDNPLITGYRIELSNNHTTEVMTKKGRKTIPLKDICDKMAGTEYPKAFLWTGWHPQCRCRMVPILVTKNDFKERVKARHTGKLKEWQPKEQTTEMPKVFVEWVNDNKSRWQANGKAAPFFIRDNYQQGDVDKGLDTRITAAIEEAKLAAATAKAKAKPTTPEPITEWDSEVMELRKIESAYSLDLDKMEHLRAEGTDRAALRKEINKQQRSYQQKKGKWEQAYQEAENQLQELRMLLVTYQSQENTKEFWELRDTIIPNHQSAIEDNDLSYGVPYHHAVKSLKSIKEKIKIIYQKYASIFKQAENNQPNVPQELKEGNGYIKNGETLDNDFFKLLNPSKPVSLHIENNDKGSYSSIIGDAVHIQSKTRIQNSPWYKKAIIYHEYGHCIDAQRRLFQDKTLTDMRDKQIKELKKKKEFSVWDRSFDYKEGVYKYTKEKRTMSIVAYIDGRLNALAAKILLMKNETFTKRGITKRDVYEQILSTQDTIKSLVIKYGDGHSTAYFQKPRMKETEYLAHAFENAFVGNRIFEKYMPEIYKEMIAYIQSLNTF